MEMVMTKVNVNHTDMLLSYYCKVTYRMSIDDW